MMFPPSKGSKDYLKNEFRNVEYTLHTAQQCNFLEARTIIDRERLNMASAQELIIPRIFTDSQPLFEGSRTFAFYLMHQGNPYVAFGDSYRPEENILLNPKMKESKRLSFVLPLNEYSISDSFYTARSNSRASRLLEDKLVLSTRDENSDVSFSTNKIAKAIFGDCAEAFAQKMRSKGYSNITITLLDPEIVKSLPPNHVDIRYVCLSGNLMPEDNARLNYISAKANLYVKAAFTGVNNPRTFRM